jgi:protein-tyrosine-phosphatase
MENSIFRVLFVCTGNSCRSPMAEGILKDILQERGIRGIVVDSAGTMAPVGMPPTNDAHLVMTERGIDISSHRAKLLTGQMVDRVDLILVMEKAHKRFVEGLSERTDGKVFLLKVYGRGGLEEEIDDPIGRDLDFYRSCRDALEEEIRRILPMIVKRPGAYEEGFHSH